MDFFRPTHPLNLENSRFFFFFEPFPYKFRPNFLDTYPFLTIFNIGHS